MDTARVKTFLTELQELIVERLEQVDGKAFQRDAWQRPEGGGGLSCVMEEGNVFERGGVNFSHVFGDKLPPSASANRPELAGRGFEAMGVSLVLHPRNPYAPTVHMNVRCFVAPASPSPLAGRAGRSESVWFGGGMDLTPYGFAEDAVHFHQMCKTHWVASNIIRASKNGAMSTFISSTGRTARRGRDFSEGGFETAFNLVESVGDHFLPAYVPILERRLDVPYGERERDFQAYRRGRYVEFNLVYDRGTIFGLQSGGRTESILMSLPPIVKWRYDWHPEPGSPEAKLYTDFLIGKDWL